MDRVTLKNEVTAQILPAQGYPKQMEDTIPPSCWNSGQKKRQRSTER